MFKKLARALKALTVEPTAFDPSVLDDPVASKTEWQPARSGGSSFGTHRLVPVDSFRIELRPAMGAILFYGVFLVVGLGMLVAAYLVFGSGGQRPTGSALVPMLLIGVVFSGVGGLMMYKGTAPIVFDKRRSIFWRGRVAPHEMSNRAGHPRAADFDEIHALQLISELCRTDKSTYYSYELNLVLRDGRRINVVDHGNGDALRSDAAAIGEFLGVPVWDAT